MEAQVARQPILDVNEETFAYELLFRSGLKNAFPDVDPDEASAKLMLDSTLLMGINSMTDGKPAFINVTRDIIVQDLLFLLPKEWAIFEILETVEPEPSVVGACSRLKNAGYRLALDDFVFDERYGDLMALSDFIKVDFQATEPEECRRLVEEYGGSEISFLAEKVETAEEFQLAKKMGYSYFQGYFFDKPAIVSSKEVPAFKLNYLNLLKEINEPEMHFQDLGQIIRRELSLTYKLLRYINSAYFALRNPVSSIVHAIALLGEREFRKWVSLVTMASMGEDKPDALVLEALVRAKFCEALATPIGLERRNSEMFLMGMFSLIDAIVDRPLDTILMDLPLAEDIKEALLGRPSRLRSVCDYAIAYEKGNWVAVSENAQELSINEKMTQRLYIEAVSWANQSMREISQSEETPQPAHAQSR